MRDPDLLTAAQPHFLWRRFRLRHRSTLDLLDPAAVSSVVLLLMLFILLQSSFVLRPGITVDLPESPFYTGVPYEALVLTLSQEGIIFFNDERTTLKGLSQAFAQAAHEQPDATLVIEADGRVLHSTLAEIYNMAMGAGIRKVALATRVSAAAPSAPR